LRLSGLVAKLAGAPRWLIGLALIAAFAAEPLIVERGPRVFDRLEAITYDLRLKLTEPGTRDPQVVIVDIDERSLAKEGRFPWPREKLARLTTALLDRYKARAVGFDVLFPEPDNSSGAKVLEQLADGMLAGDRRYASALTVLRGSLDYDAKFAAAINAKPVVLGFTFPDEKYKQRVGLLPSPLFTEGSLGGHRIPITPQPGYIANIEPLQRAAADAGHIDPINDTDGAVRRVPLIKRYDTGYYGALALALVKLAVEAPKIVPRFDSNGDLDALDVGGLLVPVDAFGNALVPYRGPQGMFRYVPATDVLSGAAPVNFEGAIVLVGTTAKGLQDLRATPAGPDFPGVEIHANLLAGMLNGELKSVPAGTPDVEALIMIIAGLLVVFAVPWRRPLLSVLSTLLIATLVLVVNLWFWRNNGAVIPLAPTLLLLLALLIYTLLSGFLREADAIRRLSDMFGEYVPPERVAQMRESGQRFSMEGESREMSVLFSDVREFTRMSEPLAPRELSALMNDYLTALTEVIHASHGTIDKYIGDAVMAFFGAPLPNIAHAKDAVTAALAMQARMHTLRREFEARGWPPLAIGVGVNTGTMNVGDMGSRFRKAYTVLGDAVNLASRLEGLTKIYGVGILIGEDTRRAVPEIVCREVDWVRVKGRGKPVRVYEPLGTEVDTATRERIDLWHDGLARYRARRFEEAGAVFAALAAHEGDARLCKLFISRCTTYAEAFLPPDWDGASVAETK
jgi:adenylate cyclase